MCVFVCMCVLVLHMCVFVFERAPVLCNATTKHIHIKHVVTLGVCMD